jgi:hypothetical protein
MMSEAFGRGLDASLRDYEAGGDESATGELVVGF